MATRDQGRPRGGAGKGKGRQRKILVLHGPNLNLLGTREPAVYRHAREPFRHYSYFSDKAAGTVVGLGAQSCELALAYVLRRLDAR